MNRRLTGQEDGLLVYWPLDEADGTTVFDRTPNGHRGIVNGASWTHSESLPLLQSKPQNSAVDLIVVPDRVTWKTQTQAIFEFDGSNCIDLPPASLPTSVAPDEVDTPMLDLPLPFPTTALKQSLWTFLDQRRLLTTRHHIVGPNYVSVPITATLHLKAGTLADTVCAQAINNIRRLF